VAWTSATAANSTSTVGAQTDTVTDGNAILGHILESRDVSRAVANNAASATGVGADVLKKMLPVVATLAIGALARQAAASPGRMGQAQMSDNIGSLTDFLDVNRDGGIADDVLGFVGKLFAGK
jgi:hypothetical protein